MKKILLLATSLLLIPCSHVRAQNTPQQVTGSPTDPGFDQKDEYTIDPIKCLRLFSTNPTLAEPECVQDEKMNEHERQQARALDRWLRGGVLTLATLMNQVRRLGGMDNMTGGILGEIQKFAQGYTERRSSMTAYRVVGARETNDEREAHILTAASEQGMNADERFFVVESEIQKGYQNAMDLEGESERASNLAINLQKRLAEAKDSAGNSLAGISSEQVIGENAPADGPDGCPTVPITEAPSSGTLYGCPMPGFDPPEYNGNEDGITPFQSMGIKRAAAAPAMPRESPAMTAPSPVPGDCSDGWDIPGKDPVVTAYRVSVAAEGGLINAAAAIGQAFIDRGKEIAREMAEAALAALRKMRAKDHSIKVM